MEGNVEVLVPGPERCPTVSSAVTPAGGVESGACDACIQQRPTQQADPRFANSHPIFPSYPL